MDFQVDLLICSDVPNVLQPREVIPATGGGPYVTKVEPGWVINGATGRKPKYFPSACYFTKSVEVHPMCVTFADFVCASSTDGPGLSHDDDLKLMNNVEISVTQCKDGRYQVCMPLRNPRLPMPGNRCQAECGALSLKCKFSQNIIKKGFAEKAPLFDLNRTDGRGWYIP